MQKEHHAYDVNRTFIRPELHSSSGRFSIKVEKRKKKEEKGEPRKGKQGRSVLSTLQVPLGDFTRTGDKLRIAHLFFVSCLDGAQVETVISLISPDSRLDGGSTA